MKQYFVFLCTAVLSLSCFLNSARCGILDEERKRNPYAVLGLAPSTYQFWPFQIPSEEDVKRAYRSESLKNHPDKHTNSKDKDAQQDKFIHIREAYDELKGSNFEAQERRREYAREYAQYGETLRWLTSEVLAFRRSLLMEFERLCEEPGPTLQGYWDGAQEAPLELWVRSLLIVWLIQWCLRCCLFYLVRSVRWLFSNPLAEEELRRRQREAYERQQRKIWAHQ